MEIQQIVRALELKLKTLEEAAEVTISRDCQAVTAAKIDYLSRLLEAARSQPKSPDFRLLVEEELEDAQAAQRLSRNPFMIAGCQVKIGLLESVLRIVHSHVPAPAARPSKRSFLVPA